MASVIEFDRVGKRYRKGRESARSLRNQLISFGNLITQSKNKTVLQSGSFWALSNISFFINQGETVGLIGHNGAGKSTVLKLISGVSQPTNGRVQVQGRVGALLELGAGFHPELSGRENIWLSGALMGMSKIELKRKFDAIVDFTGLESFLDTPIKHYSSGMFARLGFAVSIHLDPEILLIDEVLAVGDQAFQTKCYDRIAALQKIGTTICLVSHTMDIVRWMCQRAIWFSNGQIQADGPVAEVTRQYLAEVSVEEKTQLAKAKPITASQRYGNRRIEITQVSIIDKEGNAQNVFETGNILQILIRYQRNEPIEDLAFGIAVHRSDGVQISGPNTVFDQINLIDIAQSGSLIYRVPDLFLLDGLYLISVAVHSQNGIEMYDYHEQVCQFRVLNTGEKTQERYGFVSLRGQWLISP